MTMTKNRRTTLMMDTNALAAITSSRTVSPISSSSFRFESQTSILATSTIKFLPENKFSFDKNQWVD